jgi:hypothetical protein
MRRRGLSRRSAVAAHNALLLAAIIILRGTNISLVINIYFLFCRTNSVRDLIFV